MGKQRTRRRPIIEADREYIPRDEYRLCQGDGCKNVIAAWSKSVYCIRCVVIHLRG